MHATEEVGIVRLQKHRNTIQQTRPEEEYYFDENLDIGNMYEEH